MQVVLLLFLWTVPSYSKQFLRYGSYEYYVSSEKDDLASSYEQAIKRCGDLSAKLVYIKSMEIFDLIGKNIESFATAESPQIYFTGLKEVIDPKIQLAWEDEDPLRITYERSMWFSDPFKEQENHAEGETVCGFAVVDQNNHNLRLRVMSCSQEGAGYICQRVQVAGRNAVPLIEDENGKFVSGEKVPTVQSSTGKTFGILIPVLLVFILLGALASKKYSKPKSKVVILDAEMNMRPIKASIKPPSNTVTRPDFELNMEPMGLVKESIKIPQTSDGGETSGLSEYEDAIQCGAYKAQFSHK